MPSPVFSFKSADFVISGGDYTPSTTFTVNVPPVIVSVGGKKQNKKSGHPPFIVATKNYTPGTHFVFDDPAVFKFYDNNYRPEAVFRFPYHRDTASDDIALEIGGNVGQINGQLTGIIGSFIGRYDSNVPRLTVVSMRVDSEQASFIQQKINTISQQTTPLVSDIEGQQQTAASLNQQLLASFDQSAEIKKALCSVQQTGTAKSLKIYSKFNALSKSAIKLCGTLAEGTMLNSKIIAAFDVLEFIRHSSHHPIDDAGKTRHDFVYRYYDDAVEGSNYQPGFNFVFQSLADVNDGRLPVPSKEPVNFVINAGDYTPSSLFSNFKYAAHQPISKPPKLNSVRVFTWPGVVSLHGKMDNHQVGVIRSDVESVSQSTQRKEVKLCSIIEAARKPPPGTSLWVDQPREPPVNPPGHQTFIIPEQTTYIMQHNLLVTLLDLTPINLSSVELSLDADSFAWSFSGALADKSQVPLLKQTGTDPVQLIVTINGLAPWKVIVERTERSRQFGKNVISLKGRGLSALLSQPYQQATSATQGSDLTVQQIADLQLPAGWTNNWTAQTWLVPGGAYSHQNRTPIQAIMDIARNIGAIVVPSTNSQVLNIRPRYAVLPWQFDQVSPDIIIPESAITELVERPVVESQINGVYVHGNETGGELGWCRLNGTAGDRLAATESNHLLTDSIALRALGERILAGQYTQPAIQSMTLPIDGVTFPLIAIGQLIETALTGSGTIRGIVNSISITANFAKVRQTIRIGEETANNWTLFKDLLPADPLLVATLSSTDGKTAIMTLLDNGVVRVRGTGTVGNKYYIRSGKIDGEAPNQVQSEIVV